MTVALILPMLAVGPIYGKFMKHIYKAVSDKKAASSDAIEEALSNPRTVKAFATEDKESVTIFGRLEDVFKQELKGAMAGAIFTIAIWGWVFLMMDGFTLFAAYLHHRG